MKYYCSLMHAVNRFLKASIAVFLGVMSCTIILQVVFRTLKMALPWSEELTRYLMEYVVFWGAAYALSNQGHMIVNLLVDRIHGKARRLWNILIYLVLILFFLVIIRYSLTWIGTTKNQLSAAMQIPMWLVYLSVPSGCLFSILNCVYTILLELKGGEEAW